MLTKKTTNWPVIALLISFLIAIPALVMSAYSVAQLSSAPQCTKLSAGDTLTNIEPYKYHSQANVYPQSAGSITITLNAMDQESAMVSSGSGTISIDTFSESFKYIYDEYELIIMESVENDDTQFGQTNSLMTFKCHNDNTWRASYYGTTMHTAYVAYFKLN